MFVSILLAKFFGIYLIILSLAWILNQQYMLAAIEDILENPGTSLMASALPLAGGTLTLLFHNIWIVDWRGLITLLGYLVITAGVLGFVMPNIRKRIFQSILSSGALNMLITLMLLTGSYLFYIGFSA